MKTFWLLASGFWLLLCGCSTVTVSDSEGNTRLRASVPAWPWQDSTKVMDRLYTSTKTNGNFTASLTGYSETESGPTNAVADAGSFLGALIKAAK